jgi:hypothetical protein
LFRVNGDKAMLVLQGLALQNGFAPDSGSPDWSTSGGAINFTAGALQAKSCVFARNAAAGNVGGAAIGICDGTGLELSGCTFADNSAGAVCGVIAIWDTNNSPNVCKVAIADSPFGSSNTTAISTSDANGMMAVARALPGLYGVIFAVRTAPRTSSSPTASSPITAWRKVISELCLASWVESAPSQSPSRTATSRPTLLVRGGSGSGGAIEVLSCLDGVTLDFTHCSFTAGTVPARGGGRFRFSRMVVALSQ